MILVTGGAGFIGSNLLAGLEARGIADLAVADRLGHDQKWRNIAKRNLAAVIAPEELLAFLAQARGRIETIFHMGAVSSTLETDADLIARTNITLPQRLWSWCAENDARFIYASSAATYGDGSSGFDDDPSAAALAALRPLNPYGWSKHAFDRFAVQQAASNAPRPRQWAGLKFFNVYGPNEYHKGPMRSVAYSFYHAAAAGEPARLFRSLRAGVADGAQRRDFIWVGDCVSVMLWLFDNPSVSGLFNCGSGQARTFADMAAAVYAAMKSPVSIAFIDMPAEIRDRYQYFTEARMDRLRAAGYRANFTPLEAGARHYVEDYLRTPDPYV
jgi:ADP-L-glycero-D-manno-heptose 6-epimerase